MEILVSLCSNILDTISACIPRTRPSQQLLSQTRIIAHRGCHTRKLIKENTTEAFDQAAQNGVWGIEFDVRWTQDLVPIISHDSNLKRVFGKDLTLKKTNFSDLRQKAPEVPSLEEVVEKFKNKLHLMVEIKNELEQDAHLQIKLKTLKTILSPLTPEKDFHILSLEPDKIFPLLDSWHSTLFLPTSITNAKSLSQSNIDKNYAGFLGAYIFVTRDIIAKHLNKGQIVGTGFIRSKNGLYHEVNRGVQWIFSNHAIQLQKYLDNN